MDQEEDALGWLSSDSRGQDKVLCLPQPVTAQDEERLLSAAKKLTKTGGRLILFDIKKWDTTLETVLKLAGRRQGN